MLMGDAGTRKSTAIKIASKVIRAAGYKSIASDRTTKEKFLMDLAGEVNELDESSSPSDILEANLFGTSDEKDAEILIAADEFNTFVGNGNIEFLSMLGVLWDYEGEFSDRKKNSKSLVIQNPIVSVLAGNTPTGFALAFPAEAIGQGIFSRLILVHGERTDRKITFPVPPSSSHTALILEQLRAVSLIAKGEATLKDDAKEALDTIYKNWQGIDDVRFSSYSNRRFTHLIKLCLITSASAYRNTIELEDVIYANTMLTHAEHTMPKALGEFGKAKNSDVAHKILSILEASLLPVSVKDLWKQVHNDMEDIKHLRDLLASLTIADKVVATKGGYLAKRKILEEISSHLIDFSLLTPEERRYIS